MILEQNVALGKATNKIKAMTTPKQDIVFRLQ